MIFEPRDIYVFIWLKGEGYVPAGILEFAKHGARIFFRYGKKYVNRPNAIPLDPIGLPLLTEPKIYECREKTLFPALRDAAPDKWGRKMLGVMSGQHYAEINEFVALTAFFHPSRIGALAFGPTPEKPESLLEWSNGDGHSVPYESLFEVSDIIQRVDRIEDDDELVDLRKSLPAEAFLQALASSLSVGGGRPKALIEKDGNSYVVKFSKRGDAWNDPRVEYATMTLAEKCGIHVAKTHLERIGKLDLLFVERFDRTQGGDALHFISGFTLNQSIREDSDWGSYQDMVSLMRKYGDGKSAEEFYRRMVFNAICFNADDHPRNHAFFVQRGKIELTPAYDVVPTQISGMKYKNLALRCGKFGRQISVENLLSDTGAFGLAENEARVIVDEMMDITSSWEDHYRSCGVVERDMKKIKERFLLH